MRDGEMEIEDERKRAAIESLSQQTK